uniref:Uncharacterized protein n=1 Tax=Lactuca sativa TaxID=4236 RepID=A0A9R1VKL6_LACSA|nr:hypothetical protein LSAT_V11C500244950 [Lactuca sativa]
MKINDHMLAMMKFLLVAHYIGYRLFLRRSNKKVKSTFESYDVAIRMYINCALDVGFNVKLGTIRKTTYNMIIKIRMVCNQQEA